MRCEHATTHAAQVHKRIADAGSLTREMLPSEATFLLRVLFVSGVDLPKSSSAYSLAVCIGNKRVMTQEVGPACLHVCGGPRVWSHFRASKRKPYVRTMVRDWRHSCRSRRFIGLVGAMQQHR